jgi:hypothetical protein
MHVPILSLIWLVWICIFENTVFETIAQFTTAAIACLMAAAEAKPCCRPHPGQIWFYCYPDRQNNATQVPALKKWIPLIPSSPVYRWLLSYVSSAVFGDYQPFSALFATAITWSEQSPTIIASVTLRAYTFNHDYCTPIMNRLSRSITFLSLF